MGKLRPLVEKEVKDLLRDPRIYIGLMIPIIMLPLIGFVMSTAIQSAADVTTGNLTIALIDYDGTNASKNFTSLLDNMGLNIVDVNNGSLDKALEEARTFRSKALLIIPKGFEENLLSLGKVNVEVYSIVESVGISSASAQSAIDGFLDMSSETLSAMLISKLAPGIEPDIIRNPLNVTRYTVIKDIVVQVPPQALFGQLMIGYGIMIPMVLFILAIIVTQIAATATAVENEEKTLETLLTFPVTRYDILMAKLLGSSIVAVLGGVLFTVGFLIYFQGLSSLQSSGFGVGDLYKAFPSPPPETYVVLTISLILSIFFITSLGIVIGALSSDVRMSGSLLGIVLIPVLIPFLLIIYGDLKSLPLAFQLFAYALPTSYPMIMAKEMITSTIPVEVLYGIPYSAAITLVVLYATSKLLAPEKLLTLQHKLKLKRIKRKQARELE